MRVDRTTAPLAVSTELQEAEIAVVWGDDPCRLPKAKKTAAEVQGMREAHLRDGAAMVEFLCWLDAQTPKGGLSEIDVVRALEGFRRATNVLHDISFDTICGAGPNGAIMHYRVTEETNRPIGRNELLLVDSGAQYLDGTTDITVSYTHLDVYKRQQRGLPRAVAGRPAGRIAGASHDGR